MTQGEARVRRRARHRCEYCKLPQSASRLRHQLDHIISRQHGGGDEPSSLALCCVHCNLHKGPNLAGFDPVIRGVTRLFHPRTDRWREHFAWGGAVIIGLTPIGRTTIQVLAMNEPSMVAVREALILEGRFPDQ
ncbi:MAG: HNH endonuclease [Isosphaeraceae bacterium]